MGKKHIYLMFLLLLALFAENHQAIGQIEVKEGIENISRIIQEFTELKSSNKLPALKSNDINGKLTAYQLKENMHKKPWIDEKMLDDLKDCNNIYIIDVEFQEKEIKYIFCSYISKIELISAYRKDDEKWTKIVD